MSKATKRINQGYHNVELVPEGTTQQMYICDDGEYPIVDNSNGEEVFEGGFDKYDFCSSIVSPEGLAKHPLIRAYGGVLRRFKLLD